MNKTISIGLLPDNGPSTGNIPDNHGKVMSPGDQVFPLIEPLQVIDLFSVPEQHLMLSPREDLLVTPESLDPEPFDPQHDLPVI